MYVLRLVLVLFLCCNCQSGDDPEEVIIPTGGTNNGGGIVTGGGNTEPKISKITDLDVLVKETSGLINFDGRLITHNDSGGKPQLYEIDIKTGKVSRTVSISNATNVDMEAIAQDDNYIYLCDIGNNSNNRKNQVIYKISKSDYLEKDQVEAENITISYIEQTDFSKTDKSTNFDAEAVVGVENNLFLFTKNWGDKETSVYKVPNEKGSYKLKKIGSYNIYGLITGADYNKETKTIVLTGYSSIIPFIVKLTDFSINNPLDGKIEKKQIVVPGSVQIEGISANPDKSYYISAEESLGSPAVLYKLDY